MDSANREMRMNLEGDRLSFLPDDLIHKILSFISMKYAVKTSVLSSRWRFIWKSMPCLNFLNEYFYNLHEFSNFVTHVLFRRNNQIPLFSVKLRFHWDVKPELLKRVMDYAFSHNVQRLIVASLNTYYDIIIFPLSLLHSESLKHLTLGGRTYYYFVKDASTWELPALTTLHLQYVIFGYRYDVNLFSKCANLMSLKLHMCEVRGGLGLKDFDICHPLISNLTVSDIECFNCVVNVVAPHLKNLTIINGIAKYQISAPRLVSFIFKGSYNLSSLNFKDCFLGLEKAHLCIYGSNISASYIFGLLKRLHNVEVLSLNLEIIQVLSSSANLILQEPSPFVNLKSLKIYPYNFQYFEHQYKRVTMSTEVINYSKVINYLLDSSPITTIKVICHKDISTYMPFTSAPTLMFKLLELLKQKKSPTEDLTSNYLQQSSPRIASLEVFLDRHQHDSVI